MKHDRRVQNPVKEKLVEEFIQVVGEQDQPIDLNKSFLELGMNSIKAVDFVEAVNNSLGLELGVEVIFDFRGIPELAEHIAELYSAEEEKNPSPESALNSDSSMDIAIIGISGKFADSENIEDLWSHLKAGECCIKEVRRRGWDEKTYYTPEAVQKNRSVSKWGGMLSHIDQFDAGFFDISSEEAERMDPQQRLCLEESYKAFEDADYPAEKLAGKKVGVFIGGRTSDYRKRLWNKMDTFTFWGNEMSMLASRISYFFNFKGPSLTVDTACSSSLVAIHLACDSIRKGESEMALAGGVFIASTPEFFKMSSQAGLLSPDGQCKAFDPQANGMVLGEGVGVAVLKRLDDAVRDQDHIYGVIKGSAINQAGRTNGMTAPSVTSQKELIQEVYTKSQINPETIGYIEAHGTGTMLGDLMELKALSVAFKEITDKSQFCVIGSHKPNIGHATLAAGMAGLFKILMAMKDQVLPPHRPTGQGQDHFLNSPFVFNTKLRQWKSHPDMPLRAGLNALGSNGTNAHIIIEEWVEQSVQSISPIQKPYYLFLFSAKNIEALHQRLIDLADWLEHDGEQYSAEEVAYTLSAARSHFDVRYAFIASGLMDLRHHLRKVIQEGFELGGLWHQRASTFQPASEKLNNGQQLIHTLSNGTVLHQDTYQEYVAKLSDLYIQGYDLDWTGLYHKNRKVPLPSYPFCKTSYWTTEQEDTAVQEPAVFSSYGLQMRDMEELLVKLLLKQLQSLGILADQRMTLADMQKKLGMSYIYRKWLARSLQFLVDKQWVVCDETDQYSLNPSIEKEQDAWEVWERQKQHWLATPDARTQTILVEHTLRSLPRILTGEVLATDIIFPNSSMELVEGIYQNNAVADYFNNLLAQKVIDYIQERLRQNPDARIRIIEIGAGTGGTSVRVLDHLKPYLGHLEDYCYTDISKAFLVYAEKRFKADYPFVSYRVYNAEAEAAEQGISTDTYDIAIATNVLHATKNIMQTLRRVKAVLKADGLLILNEISDNSLFLHLTFGLLEGWWLFQDDTLRLPGGPAVSAEGWRRVLEQEGFKQVRFPAVEDHTKGQQIIMALSNGHVRQEAAQKQVFIQQREQKQPAVTTNNHHIAAALKNWMAEHISHALSTEAQAIDFRAAFRDYGVDSISGNNLVQVINQTFFLDLGTTILFDYSSIDQLTNFLLTHYNDAIATFFGKEKPPAEETTVGHLEERKEEPSTHETKQVSKGRQKGPIAIVGISGKFANSENVHALWEHLSKGTNLIDHTSRWRRPGDKDETVKNWETGSFIEDIDQFDPFFFNISGVEASYMDPQQRLFLMASWQALEDAGYAGKSIEGRLCGVYAGCNSGDYHHLMNDYPSREVPQAFWGNLGSVIPARIAYYLNLQGPAIAVDTACSSSLVAMHLACQGLWTGEIEMALAGGVSIQCTPELYQAEHQAGMLSPTGQCYTFDDRANGFIPGEGVGVVVLKRLEDALADGDHIYGVVRGSGINQDGTTNGITAPSLRSQVRLERTVYDQFGINPEEIQMIEAHGTGTKLGDPIEYQALTQAFQHYTDEKSYCAIGSIKTNIGHAQMAAGIAGVIKILLALKHRKIPPSLHFEQGNSNIQFKDSPFFVNTELKEWEVKPGAKRCAAVSSFGVSGTNAHMVIEEAPEVIRKHPVQPGYLLVLSARSEEALRKQAQQLIDYSKENQEGVGDICYTLLVGRQHFKHRLSCVVRDQHDMVAQLEEWIENKAVSSVFTHTVHEREHREQPALKKFGNHCIRQSDVNKEEYMDNLSTVADLFVQGYELDYPALFANGQYSRVPLPTYPFAMERYWVPQPDADVAPAREATAKAIPTQPQAVEEVAASTEESQLMTFAESWQRQDLTDERMPLPAVWVCFLSNPTHQQALRTVLQTRYPGTEVIFVAQGTAERRESPHHYQLNREDGVAYRQTLQRIAADWGSGFALLY
ncbi:beta-ketoacyl synthase N-terminal-like domain-containing protein, partial [Bacillus spizizenii]